jgi:AcrR family transcriptional regulator
MSSSIAGVSEGRRRRLTPEQRRSQLLEVGAAMFAARPYEEVRMEDVAAQAGVSRALMYRYFPAKRDFFAAIFKADSERLLAASEFDTGVPVAEQVVAGLNAHLDYFSAHRHNILTANRGALAGDPAVQAIISDQLVIIRNRMLDLMGQGGHSRQVASAALDGWLAFVRAVCVAWLQDGQLSRSEVLGLCLRALGGILADRIDLDNAAFGRRLPPS